MPGDLIEPASYLVLSAHAVQVSMNLEKDVLQEIVRLRFIAHLCKETSP